MTYTLTCTNTNDDYIEGQHTGNCLNGLIRLARECCLAGYWKIVRSDGVVIAQSKAVVA